MFRDGFEMLEQTFLRGAIVVRRYRQAAYNTAIVKTLRQANRFRGRVCARAGDNRNTSVSQFQRHHHDIAMFIMA